MSDFSPELTLLTDLYEITMMQGYFDTGMKDKYAVFDMYYRANPCGNGYGITAGLAQFIDYIENLKFSDEDIRYLETLNIFSKDFLKYLSGFSFTGDIFAVPEGTVVFPNEPLVRVKAPIAEAQLIESALLNIVNHQSLIATKAARVVYAAHGDAVLEMGLRRAQGPDAGIYGARAAMIAGCAATSNVLCGRLFGVPVRGTHAHSWIMSFPDELTAFREYARIFPDSCLLLADTYDTLKSGVPNAITVFNELRDSGHNLKNIGIRLDSGDLAFISKQARKMLNEAGFPHATICASGDLDENLIQSLKLQGAEITLWGVGTNLITSAGCPAFGGVYKLSAESCDGVEWRPKIKLSENPEKLTNPGVKKIFRFTDSSTGKIKADLIALEHETVDISASLTIFDPLAPWKRMTLQANLFEAKELLVPVFVKGKKVYNSPSVMEIREYCKNQLDTLWDEHKRLVNPQNMPVDLSEELYKLKQQMVYDARNGNGVHPPLPHA